MNDSKRVQWKQSNQSADFSPDLNRRSFIQILGAGLILPTALTGIPRLVRADTIEENRYSGKVWLTIHASGGWDPTLICDPKGYSSEADLAPINNYHADEIEEIGNFLVPPVEGMNEFFTEFQNDLLVINGIDVTTNGHEQGTAAIWSGEIDANRPGFTALFAASREVTPSLAFVSNGGYDYTGGFIPVTRLPDTDTILEIAFPNRRDVLRDDTYYLHPNINQKIIEARTARVSRIQENAHLPRTLNAMQVLESVRADDSELQSLVDVLPTEAREDDLQSQIQVALSCFSAGVSVAANVSLGGFDTHGNHDASHTPRLQQIVAAVAYAREEAERLGISERLNIIIGSDFARTPYYNDGNGKDHWSISSMMMIGADIPGGRVIGGTDSDQLPLAVDPETLELDADGVVITPTNIHAALRRLAGIEDHPYALASSVGDWLPIFEG